MEAIRPVSASLLKLSLSTTLYRVVKTVQHPKLLAVEDGRQQARLFSTEAQPQHKPVHRGKYNPACSTCGWRGVRPTVSYLLKLSLTTTLKGIDQ
jgi:hypothetical protein